MAITNGNTVKVHYVGTLDDGTQFDSSREQGREPLQFKVGAHQMIAGFEKAVMGREVGDRFDVHIPCAEAYGPVDKDLIFTVDRKQVPDYIPSVVGTKVQLQNDQGVFYATITEVGETEITLDANSEMAGKDLNFNIEIMAVD